MTQTQDQFAGMNAKQYVDKKIRLALISGQRGVSLETELDAYRVGHSILSFKSLITRIKAEEGLE